MICSIILGEQYESLDDEGFQTVFQAMECSRKALLNGDPTAVFPWLKYFPILIVRMMKKYSETLDPYLSKRYDKHCQRLDTENPEDFLSWMIMASKDEILLKENGVRELTRDNIEMIASNMVQAAIDTTVSTLMWASLVFLHHPEYVDEALDEIRSVVGINKYPEIKHRSALPKVQAIIQECLRIGSGPSSLPHKATKDSFIAGNPVEKGTQVLFNMWYIHRDERQWEDPMKFKPHRWLDDDGSFNLHKCKSYLPFLLGKRACVGEQVARAEIFLILTRMIVDFKFDQDPNENLPKMTDAVFGVTAFPLPFSMVMTKR